MKDFLWLWPVLPILAVWSAFYLYVEWWARRLVDSIPAGAAAASQPPSTLPPAMVGKHWTCGVCDQGGTCFMECQRTDALRANCGAVCTERLPPGVVPITDVDRINAIAWAIVPSDCGVLIHDMTEDFSVVAEAVPANVAPVEQVFGKGQGVRHALDGLVEAHREYKAATEAMRQRAAGADSKGA